MNDTLKTIAKRYSCRSFTDKAISDADLATIANAGLCAPSGMNRQHWHLSVVTKKDLLAEMESEGMRNLAAMPDKSMYDRIISRGGKLFYNAPAMVFIAVKEAFPKGAELIDLGIVAQNICLAATSLGIDNCQCGLVAFCFAGDKAAEFKKKLQLPNGYECGLGVLLGCGTAEGTPHAPDSAKVAYISETECTIKTLEDYIAYWKEQSEMTLQAICRTHGVEFNLSDSKAELVEKLTAGMIKCCEENHG